MTRPQIIVRPGNGPEVLLQAIRMSANMTPQIFRHYDRNRNETRLVWVDQGELAKVTSGWLRARLDAALCFAKVNDKDELVETGVPGNLPGRIIAARHLWPYPSLHVLRDGTMVVREEAHV